MSMSRKDGGVSRGQLGGASSVMWGVIAWPYEQWKTIEGLMQVIYPDLKDKSLYSVDGKWRESRADPVNRVGVMELVTTGTKPGRSYGDGEHWESWGKTRQRTGYKERGAGRCEARLPSE